MCLKAVSTQIDWADAADPAAIWEGGQVELGGTEGQLIMATISRQLLLVWMHLGRCAVSIALRRLGQSQGRDWNPCGSSSWLQHDRFMERFINWCSLYLLEYLNLESRPHRKPGSHLPSPVPTSSFHHVPLVPNNLLLFLS